MLLPSIAIVSFLFFISTLPGLSISQSQPYTKPCTKPYTQNTVFQGRNFFEGFNWEIFDDPTHGRVNYVDMQTALQTNLSYADDNIFIMRADAYQMVPLYARGRDSVRITSHDSWGDSILVLDIAHMPEGCSTWPAYWTTSKSGPWPNGGEVDILEGVNLNDANLASLHTTPNCTMPQKRDQTGENVSTNCDSDVNSNQGCGVKSTAPNTYGSGFNSIGGGWVVTSRSANAISHWFWPRNATNVPDEIRHATCTDSIIPGIDWGTPAATFVWDFCDYASHFNAHRIIFDLTFCGDWAGNAFANTTGCGNGTCDDLVNNHPEAFKNAYWELNSLVIYTPYTP